MVKVELSKHYRDSQSNIVNTKAQCSRVVRFKNFKKKERSLYIKKKILKRNGKNLEGRDEARFPQTTTKHHPTRPKNKGAQGKTKKITLNFNQTCYSKNFEKEQSIQSEVRPKSLTEENDHF
jgi:hypothetical protein